MTTAKFSKKQKNPNNYLGMDRFLLFGSISVLIIEVALLLGDLGVIPLDPFHLNQSSDTQQKIGQVLQINQNVRRRSKSSLIWENSSLQDALYAFDSVLTLSNSSAKVELEGNIQLQLHENTLVVLEPIKTEKTEHLRLKFTRGNLRSRSSQSPLNVAVGNLILEASSGSDINLRAIGEENLEVEVASGEVKINKNNSPQEHTHPLSSTEEGEISLSPENENIIKAGESISLRKGKVESRKSFSSALKWQINENMQRLYTHHVPALVHLQWQGNADSIRLINSQGEESFLTLQQDKTELYLPVRYGTFFVNLVKGQEISPSLPISVWPAEKSYYLSPLPRNRLDIHEGDIFSWTPMNQSVRYRLQVSSQTDFASLIEEKVTTTHQLHLKIPNQGKFYWRVLGEDEQGALIPSFYYQPFYSVSEPLHAPTLINPLLNPITEETSPPLRRPTQFTSPKNPKATEEKSESTNKEPSSLEEKFKENNSQKNQKKQEESKTPNQNSSTYFLFPFSSIPRLFFSVLEKIYAPILWLPLGPSAKAEEMNNSFDSPPPLADTSSHLFQWHSVPGADFYIIEISVSPDFREPIVNTKIKNEQYLWKGFKKQNYYWRVAGGKNNGRMGLFSLPAKIDLTQTKASSTTNEPTITQQTSVNQNAQAHKPKLREENKNEKILEKKEITKEVVSEIEEENSPQEAAHSPLLIKKPIGVFSSVPTNNQTNPPILFEEEKQKYFSYLTWHPTYHLTQIKNDQQVKGQMQGLSLLGFDLLLHLSFKENEYVLCDFKTQTFLWEPKDKNNLPSQNHLRTSNLSLKMLYGKNHRRWSYGLAIERTGFMKRSSAEQVIWQIHDTYGLSLAYTFPFNEKNIFPSSLSLTAKPDLLVTKWENSWNYLFEWGHSPLLTGLHFDFTYEVGSHYKNKTSISSGIHFGYRW